MMMTMIYDDDDDEPKDTACTWWDRESFDSKLCHFSCFNFFGSLFQKIFFIREINREVVRPSMCAVHYGSSRQTGMDEIRRKLFS